MVTCDTEGLRYVCTSHFVHLLCMYICVCMFVNLYIRTYVHVSACVYVHTYVCT